MCVCCVGGKAVFFLEINLALISFLSHNVQFIKINSDNKGVVVYLFFIRKYGFKRLRLLEFYCLRLYKFIFL